MCHALGYIEMGLRRRRAAMHTAAENPVKLRELQQFFLLEGAKYNVFPLDDRRLERFDSELAGRPDPLPGRTTMTLYRGMSHMSRQASPSRPASICCVMSSLGAHRYRQGRLQRSRRHGRGAPRQGVRLRDLLQPWPSVQIGLAAEKEGRP